MSDNNDLTNPENDVDLITEATTSDGEDDSIIDAEGTSDGLIPDALYQQFMDAADHFDQAKTRESQEAWCERAENVYAQLAILTDELTVSRMKRINRTINYMRDELSTLSS